MKSAPNYWHDEMGEDVARRVLGDAHFEWVIEKGVPSCGARAVGAWQANLPESYGAYKAAERVAQRRAHAAFTLNAFDDLAHEGRRDQLDIAAKVRRSARGRL
ncbi:hypothetical protein [Paraburkholderia caballeronis]|uniref:hypothetical protein n=1 Tax=Paraburkholderia caballeronis TaxID=416943 RepID=UPI001066AA60|nr:hypothetical protein [Paraburkholderia caballeronis]TDV06035.1 hypothetical protein C7408_12416 [Paraburkholderia caballeronis]TDV09575.1 hypothetical protein C7406_12616 [Paraburkholderia caballeronis]TDV21640.1 hypothetical protein C7404_12116 [Paraburkholderia caballeronis]